MTLGPYFRRSCRIAAVFLAAAAALGADQTVTVGPGFAFSPATVTVAPGEAVIWSFQALHTSTSDAMTGPEVWDSGILSSGTFSHTFLTAGSYPYYCALHSFPGGTMMNGVVNVKGAGATATPTVALTSTPTPTQTETQTPTPTETSIPSVTPSPSPTALPAATATPPPTSAGPAPSGIPLLDPIGQAVLALALAAVGIAALALGSRR
jgi:plastocyanin